MSRSALRRHASRRAHERYGIELCRSTRDEILAAIRAGRSRFVSRSTPVRAVHDVTLAGGARVRVVYDRRHHEIVTFLTWPEDAA